MERIIEHIEWIFSGIGVLAISLAFAVHQKRKKKEDTIKSAENTSTNNGNRTVNQYGDKSMYIENNKREITIN